MKKLLYILLLLASTSVMGAGWTDPNTYQGLWEFETTNTTATLDTSGAGHTMTNLPNIATGPTWTIVGTNQYGRVEHGYTFDGTQSFKDGSMIDGATSITMFAWINYTVHVNYGGVLFERDTGLIWQGAGTKKMRFDAGSNTTYASIFMATEIPSNEWHFVWARWKSYTTPEIYYDNVIDCTPAASNSLGAIKVKTTPGMLIGYNNENIAYFKGMIDGVGMFVNGSTGYATTNTMQQIMNNTHPTNNIRVRPTDVIPSAKTLLPFWTHKGNQISRYFDRSSTNIPQFAQSILWYRHNEYTNSSGYYVDSSAVGTNVSIPNGGIQSPTWVGSSSGNYYDGNDYSTSLSKRVYFDCGTSMTWSVWVNIDPGLAQYAGLLVAKGTTLDGFTGHSLYTNFAFYIQDTRFTTPTPVSVNTWHHFAATWSGTQTLFYLDGVLTYNWQNLATNVLTNTVGAIQVGYDNNVRYFKGYIDDELLYRVSITSNEVLQHYQFGHDGPTNPVMANYTYTNADQLAYWTFDSTNSAGFVDSVSSLVATSMPNTASGPQSTLVYGTNKAGFFAEANDYLLTGIDYPCNIAVSNSVTVMGWLKPSVISGSVYRNWLSRNKGTNQRFYFAVNPSSKWYAAFGNGFDEITSSAVAANLAWTHVAVVCSNGAVTGRAELYVNGVLENTDTSINSFNCTGAFAIGNLIPDNTEWAGWIDEVRIITNYVPSNKVFEVYSNTKGWFGL